MQQTVSDLIVLHVHLMYLQIECSFVDNILTGKKLFKWRVMSVQTFISVGDDKHVEIKHEKVN